MNLSEAVSVDPAGYETANCQNCHTPIARRVYAPEVGWPNGEWRHGFSNSVWCDLSVQSANFSNRRAEQ